MNSEDPQLGRGNYTSFVKIALQGQLGDAAKTVSRVTIEANDDPYGVFVVSDSPKYVNESFTSIIIPTSFLNLG